MSSRNNTLGWYLSLLVATILVLLPFHALLTTWLGSNFGHLDAFRIWKELLIAVMAPLAVWLSVSILALRKYIWRDWLVWTSLAYAVLFALTGVLALRSGRVNASALIYSLLSNLRFIGFMLIVIVASSLHDFLRRNWLRFLVGPAVIVIIFGLLQRYVLSYDFLRHFGYGPDTIPAYQTVDQKLEYRRIQSTLRGANPLGAYLLIVLTAIVSRWRNLRVRTLVVGLLLGGGLALFFTYSRSAWLALIFSAGLVLWWQFPKEAKRSQVFTGFIVVLIVVIGGLLISRQNMTLQNTFFHTDSTSVSTISSNASRVSAIEHATKEVFREPFGRGPGTAGPASTRNNHPPRIAENYFLQIAQEVGLIGLALFVVINALVIKKLWRRRAQLLPQVLLATWAGLLLINLVSHAWADDTLGLLWWGFAGIALAQPVILNKKRNRYATQKS